MIQSMHHEARDKLELEYHKNKNVHCIQLRNARLMRTHLTFICQLDKSRDVPKLARSMSQQKAIKRRSQDSQRKLLYFR